MKRKFIIRTTYGVRWQSIRVWLPYCRLSLVSVCIKFCPLTGVLVVGTANASGWGKQEEQWADRDLWNPHIELIIMSLEGCSTLLRPSPLYLSSSTGARYDIFKVCKSEWLFNLLTAPFSACFVSKIVSSFAVRDDIWTGIMNRQCIRVRTVYRSTTYDRYGRRCNWNVISPLHT